MLSATGLPRWVTPAALRIAGSGDIYGGTAPGLGNVISGNGYGGINSTGSITVEGNYIGTDSTGNVGVGNGGYVYGISNISPSGAAVTVTISNNVVSGNQGGILLQPGVAKHVDVHDLEQPDRDECFGHGSARERQDRIGNDDG